MMEDSDILTLGWGCETGHSGSSLWHPGGTGGEEFVTLEVEGAGLREGVTGNHEYATLEVAKERDRQYFNSCVESEKMQEWDIMRLEEPRPLAAPTPILATPVPVLSTPSLVPHVSSGQEFYVIGESFQPPPPSHYPGLYHGGPLAGHLPPSAAPHYLPVHQDTYHNTYQQQIQIGNSHPINFYTPNPFDPSSDPKRHAVRSPASGKFVRGGGAGGTLLSGNKQRAEAKERKRPGPKAKLKSEIECAKPVVPEEPEYDPEVIANAHLTMEEDFYKCSVCKMKFKQPGNARRHIITVHRNEKPHECTKCGAKFGRKDKLKTHMMRNHGFNSEDIKNLFKHSGQGRQRSSIIVNRDNRKSTESSGSSEDPDMNPLNLKTTVKRGAKHFNKRRKLQQ